jgi:hypothetical protein
MDFDLILDDLLMIFRSRTHLAKPSKTMTLTTLLLVFTLQKNIYFYDFPHLCRYQFLNLFLISFGIDVGSILEAIWNKFQGFFAVDFCLNFQWIF